MRIDEVNNLVLDVGSDHCLSLKLKISLQHSAIKLESAALRWNPIFFSPDRSRQKFIVPSQGTFQGIITY